MNTDIWGDLWKLLTGQLSPSGVLLKYVLESILKPKPVDMITEQYFEVLSFFATLLVPFIFIGLLVSLWYCATQRTLLHLKRWATGGVYALGLLAFAPLVISMFQYFMTVIGVAVLGMMLETDDSEKIIQILSTFSGDPSLTSAMSLLQAAFLLVLACQIQLVMLALYASTIALMIGLVLRFLPWIGEPLFLAGIKTLLVGAFGYFIVLSVIGITVGFGRIFVGDNSMGRSILNVVAIALAVIVLWRIMSSLKGQFEAVVHAATEGYGKATGNSGGKSRGAGGRGEGSQGDSDADNDLKGTRHARQAKDPQLNDTSGADPASASKTNKWGKVSNGSDPSKPQYSPPRASSTSARLAANAARSAPVPQAQAAVAAYEAAQAAQTAKESLKSHGSPQGNNSSHNGEQRHERATTEASNATQDNAGRNQRAASRADSAHEATPRWEGGTNADPSSATSEKPARWASASKTLDAENTARDYQERHRNPPPPPPPLSQPQHERNNERSAES